MSPEEKLALLLEAERRGLLNEDKKQVLNEARKRGLVPYPGTEMKPNTARQWSEQNPKTAFLEKTSEVLQKGLVPLGFVYDQTIGNAGRVVELARKEGVIGGRSPKLSALHAAEDVAGVMKRVRQGAKNLEQKADEIQYKSKGEKYVAPNLLRAVSEASDFLPSETAEIALLPISMGKAGASPAITAAGVAKGVGSSIKRFFQKIPGADIIVQLPDIIKRHGRDLKKFNKEFDIAQKQMSELKAKIAYRKAKLVPESLFAESPIVDDMAFGKDVKALLNAKARADKAPLAASRKILEEDLKNIEIDTKSVIDRTRELKNDLRGVLSESKDAQFNQVVKKYGDLENFIEESTVGYEKLPDGTVLFKPATKEVRVAEKVTGKQLIQDRSVLGSAFERLSDNYGKGNKQTHAIRQVIEILDDELEKAAQRTGKSDLIDRVGQDRAAWVKFYNTHFNDTAIALRSEKTIPSKVIDKILESQENVLGTKELVPEVFEQVRRREAAGIIKKLEKASVENMDEILSSYKPGYLESLFTKENLSDLRELAVFQKAGIPLQKRLDELAELKGGAKVIPSRRVGDDFEMALDKRSGARERVANLRAAGRIGAATGIAAAPILWLVGAEQAAKIAATAGVLGVATEKLARAYVTGSPAARKAIADMIRGGRRWDQYYGPKFEAGKVAIIAELGNEEVKPTRQAVYDKKLGMLSPLKDKRIKETPQEVRDRLERQDPEYDDDTYQWPVPVKED